MNDFELDPQDDAEDETEYVSKTHLKKEMLALQELAVHLTTLNATQLAKIPLTSELEQGIAEEKLIKKNEARRRHHQFLGRLMRSADHEAIAAAVAGLKEEQDRMARLFHVMERWRDELVEGDQTVLERFIEEFPQTDRQQLRHLVRSAKGAAGSQQASAHARKLFRFIRESMAANDQ